MRIIKHTLIFIGIITIIFSVINSVYENSIWSNKWTFAIGILTIWFALDERLQKKFEDF
jgi:hypothetical protein